ncbi:hypothetical protein BH20GEM2_BH20GEM2_16740 [soil metagenome]
MVGGRLHTTAVPPPLHQLVVIRLAAATAEFVRANHFCWVVLGPIDVLFAVGDYLVPDLIFIRRERGGIISDRGIEAAPDLVVEVLSRSTAERDRGIKRERYMYFGVPTYWIVDPEAGEIEVYRLAEGKAEPEIVRDVLSWRPVPGEPELEIRLAEVLRGFE